MQQTDVTGKNTTYHYDLSNRLTEVWDNGKCIAKYEYYLDDTIKSLNCGSLYTTYGYDADQNVTSLKTVLGEEVCIENHYSYDGNGNRVEKRQLQGTTTYTYDSRNRLVKAEYPDRMEQLFYDPAGNRSKRITETTEEIYQYDKRNRLTTYTKDGKTTQLIYDPAGNLLKDSHAIYEYDAFHRNTKVETYNGNIQINRYDAEGLRHEIEENGTLVSFLFRGREVVVEETKEEQIRYIRTNELLASDAESARTYYHYASDEMGSITHVVEDTTILNRYEYDAWGNTTTCEETVNNRFRFNGQQYDPVSQQYYLRARYYNPVIGRFTQEDTYQEDGLNLYVYCRNNPVYYVDPSGNTCETDAKSITNKIKHVSKNERKKLVAHNQNKGGTLSDGENRIISQSEGRGLGQGNGSESGSNSEAWKAIDEYRSRTNGLEPLGDTIPTRGDKNGTVAFIEVNGEKIFGVNSSLLSEADKTLGKQYFADMKNAGYFGNVKAYGSGSAQVFTHAEGYTLMKVHSMYGDNMGKNITIYCDRTTCGICRKNLPYFKEYFGLDSLTVINKDGKIFEF